MLLTYSHSRFAPLIRAGIKIHTIREDKNNRWKPGREINHWMGNPRNVSKNPHPFGQERNDVCISTQVIEIIPASKLVSIDNRVLNRGEIEELAYNDGLENSRIFFKWFSADAFIGKIIHWTEKRY